MKKTLLALLILSGVIITGCGHTNNLAKINITGRTAIYRTTIASDVASSIAVIEPPNDNTAIGIAATIGSILVSAEGRRKLESAINGDSVANAVGLGIRQATMDYLGIKAVEEMSANPELIIETELSDCKIFSASSGLFIRVRGESRVIERGTGRLVWENDESHTVPLSQTYLATFGPRGIATGASIFNAVQLLSLSESEIRAVVQSASRDAGREIGETLREDVADLHK